MSPRSRIRKVPFLAILLSLAFILLLLVTQQVTSAQPSKHPLDALSEEEIRAAVETLKEKGLVKEDSRFATMNLHEPPKEEIWNWKPSVPIPGREAFVVVKQGLKVFEGVVDLATKNVVSWQEVKDAQPGILAEEYELARELVGADPRWQAAMRKRGIKKLDKVVCDPMMYPPGYFGPSPLENRRLLVVPCGLETGDKNFWAHPIEGIKTLVDLNKKEVVEVEDTGVVPIPQQAAGLGLESAMAQVRKIRQAPRLLQITQPKGPTFKVNGQVVSWQNWQFHFRIDPRVGLVLSTVTFNDKDKARKVMYEGSIGEIFVPYGDPDPEWYNKTFMDAGEFYLGKLAVPLVPNLDCPMNATYFDTVFADDQGSPYKQSKVACLFEQRGDGGIEWRHYEYFNESNESRSRRELVLRFMSTIGNYDYVFDWVFLQNGTIRVWVGASGIEAVKAVKSRTLVDDKHGHDTRHGTLVDAHTVATTHQHLYNFRLDLDVDSTQNSFVEVVPKAVPVDNSPRKSAMVLDTKTFRTELEARRSYDLMPIWHVVNPNVKNANGYNSSYVLHKGWNTNPLLTTDDWPRKRAGFINYHLWVTPYNSREFYAAGDYPNQSKGGDGLPRWTQANRPIENTDIVLWYTLGNTHVVRPEEWPVLTTEEVSFELRPFNFFNRAPSLDLPKYH
jgi:primary-amine oxidase